MPASCRYFFIINRIYCLDNLFFPSGRWDIETKSGLLIKLPRDNFKKSIELFLSLKGEDNIQKIKKIDLRQFNQVVVNG